MAELFNAGHIKAPLHLAGGNEHHLISIFKTIAPNDWVLASWRSHYHCLLKGVPPEALRDAILSGRSIALCFPEYRVLCSAIVGGIAPIAVGIAWSIKRNGGDEKVHCFLGDMSVETGIVHECMKYAAGHNLPVWWIIEDNNIGGAGVPTQEVWGDHRPANISAYIYDMTTPFVGTGRWRSL